MKKSEVATLLALCAAYDNRTVGEANVEAWALALPDGLGFDEAKRIVLRYYRTETRPVMPADVIKRIPRDPQWEWLYQ